MSLPLGADGVDRSGCPTIRGSAPGNDAARLAGCRAGQAQCDRPGSRRPRPGGRNVEDVSLVSAFNQCGPSIAGPRVKKGPLTTKWSAAAHRVYLWDDRAELEGQRRPSATDCGRRPGGRGEHASTVDRSGGNLPWARCGKVSSCANSTAKPTEPPSSIRLCTLLVRAVESTS